MRGLTIDHESSALVTTIATMTGLSDGASRVEVAQARLSSIRGLRGAAIHVSPARNVLFEYFQWQDEGSMRKGEDALRLPYVKLGANEMWFANSKRVLLTPGPNQPSVDFSLQADPSAPRPTLVSYITCEPERQTELTAYLANSAERFTTLFGGWIGAALHPREDERGITEYLQFETIERMAALQDRTELIAHKNHLATFGAFQAQLVLPVAVLNPGRGIE